ncbi:proteasome assembly chaperone family protein [Methanothermobacter tenebrarum]|uniref:Proteasome assembly chaperone family protein n=1 Tax=Methanothermobacter tenebrarum TaxID=680118 RepID=A0A328PIG2_9EURY|nr:proteasome assembly chaperone family protein [Methanothermobacter tenebrarum]MBC7100618.1 proteasome assembly chaperone family protein [Methanobacteriales archaeon]MBC7118127.1 proteasome assembly chaperone family protein [Methanobacteriaceae archaeon]NPV65301.1 proteasome assembly chaperone family protein [Methanobacteriaceae archaeon]RAO79655.1 proteasome assembly chaperone family protein [Methanothermobacter tenebrarum]
MKVETKNESCTIVSEEIENAIVLEGSPGLGLIGNIVGWLLVDDLKMREIGYIDSKYFPPLAVLYRGVAIHPFRIYEGEGLVLFLSDFILPSSVVYDMTNAMVKWMKRNNSKELITFNSVIVRQKSHLVAGAANSKDALKRLGKLDIPILPFGNINGISGTLLTRCAIENIPASCLFGEILTPYPDPRAAAEVVEVLNKMLGLEVDTEPLLEEAQAIESRLKKLAEKVHKTETPTTPTETPIYM